MKVTKLTLRLVAVVGVLGLVLSGCATDSQPPAGQGGSVQPDGSATALADPLSAHGLDGLTGKEIVDRLDTLPQEQRATDMFASIRSNEVIIIGADESQTPVTLPEDQFYVSIAPFETQTHECFFHSLTTCVGELQNQEIQVLITNAADGSVLVDETTTTFDNGFVGYWLPRDITATVQITANGKTSTADLGTGQDDPTCVTTMQLT